MVFDVQVYESSRKQEVLSLIEGILCREYAVQDDLSSEDDLQDIEQAYAAPGGRFLVAVSKGVVVGTAGIHRVSDDDCELRHLHVAHDCRRQGVASSLVSELLSFVRERGYRRILLELRPEMEQTMRGYGRYGFTPVAEGVALPREGEFMAIRL